MIVKRVFLLWAAVLSSLFFSTACFSQTLEQVRATIEKSLGNKLNIQSIEKTPINGLYEVFANNTIFYMDGTGRYVLSGVLADAKLGVNLTEQSLMRLTRVDTAKLPLQNAIKYVKGTGKRQIIVFEDPNCPYCKRLDQELDKLNNVTIYTFIVPVLREDSKTKSTAILCSNNPVQAWNDWMIRAKVPVASLSTCQTDQVEKRLEANIMLMQQLGLKGVPVIYLGNGILYQGDRTAAAIDQALNKVK